MSRGWHWEGGNWYISCDVCSKQIYASEAMKRWDGLIVCPEDYEYRHPQDLIRVRHEKQSVPFIRIELPDVFSFSCDMITSQGISDYGVADCARASIDTGDRPICALIGSSSVAGIAVAGCMKAGSPL